MTEYEQLSRIERKIDQIFAILRGECPHVVCEWENAPAGRQQVCAECGEVLVTIDGGSIDAARDEVPVLVERGLGLFAIPDERQ